MTPLKNCLVAIFCQCTSSSAVDANICCIWSFLQFCIGHNMWNFAV